MYIMYILCKTVSVALELLTLFFLLRAIFSFIFPFEEENRFSMFLVAATEPFIIPFRILFDRFGWFQNIPLDIPFFAASLVVSILASIL